ncbi:hypothetical protein PWG71_17315 [Nocardiopsis sp. N85]|uniref:hypothetical protein n=1 Tax=Nocardiopsis sp. N85 TaxID=3029400 RepID=UPI00237F6130|nr:hypothetical protein [Nocardiopsis sp. N85]MDE3723154.1 hypothetical protein [Nocardiopsis sp. N85]
MDVPDVQERNGGSSMSDFTSGSREKVIVIGIIATLVVALFLLFRQLVGGSDTEEPSTAPETAIDATGGSGEAVEDVMALVPHSEEELRSAAETARDFVAAYSEVRPEETDDERLSRLSPLIAQEFFGTVEDLVLNAPTGATPRDTPSELRASARVTGIRLIAPDSVIFEVEVRFLSEAGDDGGNDPVAYAVTMVPEEGGWGVYAFQGAAVGNEGEGRL